MKANRLIAGAASVALVLLTVAGWAGSTASKGTTKVGAVAWANSLDEAMQRAIQQSQAKIGRWTLCATARFFSCKTVSVAPCIRITIWRGIDAAVRS